jgi:hypothetical protein
MVGMLETGFRVQTSEREYIRIRRGFQRDYGWLAGMGRDMVTPLRGLFVHGSSGASVLRRGRD